MPNLENLILLLMDIEPELLKLANSGQISARGCNKIAQIYEILDNHSTTDLVEQYIFRKAEYTKMLKYIEMFENAKEILIKGY